MDIVPANLVIPLTKRIGTFQLSDGRTYYGKGTACPKRGWEYNPAWLANEIVYAHVARAAGLSMPETAIVSCDGQLYFGSESRAGRRPLDRRRGLRGYVTSENRSRLTVALLLDLTLLNSDRTASNTLVDGQGRLWFFDHDKSLWGDGRPAAPATPGDKPGDLGRLDLATLDEKFEDYLGDYLCLRFHEAADVTFFGQPWSAVVRAFDQLPLMPGVRRGPASSSTSRCSTTASAGTRPWATSRRPITRLHGPDDA